jgi:NAD(P)H-flavin reductase
MSRWGGQPARLLRKVSRRSNARDCLAHPSAKPNPHQVCHVTAVRGSSPEWERLSVFTLTFANPPGVESLGVRIDCGDVVKVVVPNFKPKSYSMSAQRHGEFDITVKVYPGGVCSGYLDSVQVGESISVFKMGAKQRVAGRHVGLIAYGVGITEALPLCAAELSKPDAEHVRLLWASKTYGDLFWHDEIAALRAAHPERFSVATILSREQREGCLHGRCSAAVLAEVFDGAWGTAAGGPHEAARDAVRFLSVGTKPMMRQTEAMLRELDYATPGRHMLLA